MNFDRGAMKQAKRKVQLNIGIDWLARVYVMCLALGMACVRV